jgi:thymidine kinase
MSALYFRYSAMASGKSLDLLKTAYNYEERDKKVVLFTSNLDNRFGQNKIAYLMALADEIEELKTVCKYGDKANMNLRIQNGTPVFSGSKVMIGGNDSYMPVCRSYYKQMKEKYDE